MILIVDDEIQLAGLIAQSLRRKGVETITASGGHEAFQLIQKHQIKLVISDVRMADGSGTYLLEEINKNLLKIPVIFVTGFCDVPEEELLELGAKAVLSKPINNKILFNIIEQELKTSK